MSVRSMTSTALCAALLAAGLSAGNPPAHAQALSKERALKRIAGTWEDDTGRTIRFWINTMGQAVFADKVRDKLTVEGTYSPEEGGLVLRYPQAMGGKAGPVCKYTVSFRQRKSEDNQLRLILVEENSALPRRNFRCIEGLLTGVPDTD